MRYTLLIISFIVMTLHAFGATRITVTLTVTNQPSDGNTFTLNGTAKTFKTTVATPPTQVLIGASKEATTTNLFNHTASYPYSGVVIPAQTSTNIITFTGNVDQAMTASLSASYGTLSYSTQTVSTVTTIRVPFSAEPTTTVRTNNANNLIADVLNTYGTTAITATAPPLANFVNISQAQTITGAKTFSNSAQSWNGGYVTNAELRNMKAPYSSAGADIKFYTSGGVRQYGITPDANGIPSIYYINAADDLATPGNYSPASANILNALSADLRYGQLAAANSWTGTNMFTRITNSTLVNSTISASAAQSTFTISADTRFTRVNNTSLANGNNAGINFGTDSVYVKVKPGPTAAFTLNGISGGANGRLLIIENATGQAMTIAYDSGVDGTAANRIYTMSGANVSTTGNCVAILLYDSEISRWKLISLDSSFDSGTSVSAGYIPYATAPGTFANSPLYRVNTNSVGLNGTTRWLAELDTANFAFGGGLNALTTGDYNISIGNTLNSVTTANNNIAIGDSALATVATGWQNVAVGRFAGQNTTGDGSTYVGHNAGRDIVAGEQTIIGHQAMYNNTSGSRNAVVGYLSATASTASSDIAAVGHSVLNDLSTGSRNTAIGSNSGNNLTTGVDGIFVGYATEPKANSDTNFVVIGSSAKGMGPNTAIIGTNGVSVLYLNGTVGWFRGTGSPESVVTANVGSFYSREDGGAGTSFYVKQSGTGNTGWAAK